jgi:hypothetical protein
VGRSLDALALRGPFGVCVDPGFDRLAKLSERLDRVFERLGTGVALALGRTHRLLGLLTLARKPIQVLAAVGQEFQGAALRGVEFTDDGIARERVQSHARQFAERLHPFGAQPRRPLRGRSQRGVERILVGANARDRVLDRGERLAAGDHRCSSQAVIAPPRTGMAYSTSRKPRRFSPRMLRWMMPSSFLSRRTASNTSRLTRTPHLETVSTRPSPRSGTGTLRTRPSAATGLDHDI